MNEMDNWPLVMTTLRPTEKTQWMLRDPDRYFRQCWAERLPEARAEVQRRLGLARAARDGRWQPAVSSAVPGEPTEGGARDA